LLLLLFPEWTGFRWWSWFRFGRWKGWPTLS